MLIICGLLKSPLTTFTPPVLVPVTVGVKVTEIVHLDPGSNDDGQLLVAAKSPVVVTAPTAREAVVEGFITLKVIGWLVVPTGCDAKVNLFGLKEMAWPVAFSCTTRGLAGSLENTINPPCRRPEAVGENVRVILQLPEAAIVALQVLVCDQFPFVAMLTLVRELGPVLVRVTVWATLFLPYTTVPKFVTVVRETNVPVPVKFVV